MIARTTLATLASALLTLSASADSALAGKSFQIDMVTVGKTGITTSCVRFDTAGTMAMGSDRSTMVWSHPYGARDEFVAVTRGDIELPVHRGAHGIIAAGNVLIGTSIDQTGHLVGFLGSQVKRCFLGGPRPTPTSQCVSAAAATVGASERALASCAPAPYVDAATQLYTPPTASDPSATSGSRLVGREFLVTLNDTRTPAQCWRFDQNGVLITSQGGEFEWAPDYLYDPRDTFQSVTRGRGGPASFYGSLIGTGLLDIRGMHATQDRSREAYGVGFEVSRCAIP